MQPPVDHVLVRTTKPKAAAAVRIGAGLGQQKRVELAGLLRVCFARVEPWLQARKYVSAVASGVARRNGWTIAEQAGTAARIRRSGCSTAPCGTPGVRWAWCAGSRWRAWMRRPRGRGGAAPW
jgi:hypothetical protein